MTICSLAEEQRSKIEISNQPDKIQHGAWYGKDFTHEVVRDFVQDSGIQAPRKSRQVFCNVGEHPVLAQLRRGGGVPKLVHPLTLM